MATRTSTRLTPVRGRVARVTRLDNCGRIVVGAYNQAASEGIVTAAFTPNTVDTEEINVPNWAGKRCVYEPSVTELAGYALVLTFCNVDFEMFEIITGQTLVFNADGNVDGIEVDTAIPVAENGFAFEAWTGSQGGDVCEDPNAQGDYGYLLLPRLVGGILGEFSLANGAINFTITGANTKEGNQWGNGPYAVQMDSLGVPGLLVQPVSKTAALRLMTTTVAPPAETIGARPVLDKSLPEFTALAATKDTDDATGHTAEFALTPVATGPVWYDFGDGEWDFVAAPGATSHEYEAVGTYTVLASQNGVNWISEDVTIPFP
jgi:hypothetical protein